MPPVLKKTLILLVKLLVLSGILWWAYTKMPMDDQLALAVPQATTLTLPDGKTITLGPKDALRIVSQPLAPDGNYQVQDKAGNTLPIPAKLVGEAGSSQTPLQLLPGVRTVLGRINWSRVTLAIVLFGPAVFLLGVRWYVLLRGGGVQVRFWTTIRLNFLGLFFNTFMPGGTGGDIIKAVAITRYTDRKAEAATLVVVDRVLGLIGLMLMAAVMVPFNWTQLAGIGEQVGLILIVLAVGSLLFYSAGFRRLIRWDKLLAKLPGSAVLSRIDAAVYDLRHKKGVLLGTIAITMFLQTLGAFAVYQAGQAIGMDRADFGQYLVFIPMGYLVNAVPISFGGLGLMEGALAKLFSDAGAATFAQGFMLGLLIRLMSTFWSLPGGVFALTGTGQADRKQAEEASVRAV